ncbi:hypothetical protein, partial [Streptococcus suis]|uniref:hypothetical protein n=1 Tax=Streptococcus suis TaxID=1307 RepID=UPI001EE927AF
FLSLDYLLSDLLYITLYYFRWEKKSAIPRVCEEINIKKCEINTKKVRNKYQKVRNKYQKSAKKVSRLIKYDFYDII